MYIQNPIKLSLISLFVIGALTACGGSDSSNNDSEKPETPEVPETTTSQFIDTAVAGLPYYTASGKSGVTNAFGEFDANEGETITFYLGGVDGLAIGAASNQEILTPFSAAGKYNRAINMAIIFQSLDKQFGSQGDDVLTVPEFLQNSDDPTVVSALQELKLDDRDSTLQFLEDIGVESANLVTEDQAVEHLNDSLSELAFGSELSTPQFARGSNSIIKGSFVEQYRLDQFKRFVHADTTLPGELHAKTQGMPNMFFKLEQANAIYLEGSNDTSLSESAAEDYLNDATSSDNYTLPSNFAYHMKHPEEAQKVDEPFEWDEMPLPFGAENASELNRFSSRVVDDADEGESPQWQRETVAGNYDPVTKVYTEIRKKILLSGDNCDQQSANCTEGRETESVDFYYEVESVEQDKYVDFTGTWKDASICADGGVASMTMQFADQVTISGTECVNGEVAELEPETMSYADLATIDYWWFGQESRESKATLAELNTRVRFCDQDDYEAGTRCDANDDYFVKWEYLPAGADWSEGILERTKMTRSGEVVSRSSMRKVM